VLQCPAVAAAPAVCPKGTYLASPGATSCVRCIKDNYCPGGDKVEQPVGGLGPLMQCGTNMVTRSDGARSRADCVSPVGYAQTSPGVASPCGRSEYAPPLNRLAKCIRCQSGLEEPLDSGLNATAGDRRSKKAVCSEWLWVLGPCISNLGQAVHRVLQCR
jgi:hypothetical protein